MGDAIERLAEAIGYPEPAGVAGSGSAVFKVDDLAVEAALDAGRLVLRYELDVSEENLVAFAGYAAGRILREPATLAYDPSSDRLFLWQAVRAEASAADLRAAFERFLASCDWWRARADDAARPAPEFPEVMIRP